MTKETFIRKARKVYGNLYDYSILVYDGCYNPIEVICPIHGKFSQRAYTYLQGHGCQKCGNKKRAEKKTFTQQEWIGEAIKVHGKCYDYSNVVYEGCYKKVEILCSHHGSFWTAAYKHLDGKGCRKCCCSHGERKIMRWLESHRIDYEHQKKFDDCRSPKNWKLIFDFFLPDKNIVIEFDGQQHFKYGIKFFGRGNGVTTKEHLEYVKQKDKIKNDYAHSKSMTMIRIPYRQINKIEDILERNIVV